MYWLPAIICCLRCRFRSRERITQFPGQTARRSQCAESGKHSNCNGLPPAGTGRAAVMPPLQLGHDQAIVYVDFVAGASTLKSYGVRTGKYTTILSVSGSIGHAQISNDGQWILFTLGMYGFVGLDL